MNPEIGEHSPTIVDEAAVRRFVGHDVELLQALVVAYLQQAPTLAGNLHRAARLEPPAFQQELVRLRGACRLLFAERALRALDRVEAALRKRRLSRRHAVEQLLPELGILEATLLAMRAPLERELGWKVLP